MNRSEVLEILRERINANKNFGDYQLEVSKEKISAVKSTNNITYEFGINIHNQPKNCKLVSLNTGIGYQKIEEIIIPILKESEIVGESMNPNTSWTINLKAESEILEKANQINSNLPIGIVNDGDLENVFQIILKFYNDVVKEFELKYDSELNLWKKIENKNYKEIGSILTSGAVFKYFYLANKFQEEKTKLKFELWMENINKSIKSNPDEIQYKRYWKAGKLLSQQMNYDM